MHIIYMNIELLREDFCHHATFMRGVSKNTVKRYRQNISNFARASKIDDISEVNEHNVRMFFLNGRMNKQWKASTFRTYYMTLLVFFRWCIKNGYLEKNDIEDLELPKIKKSLPKGLKRQDAFRLLEVAYNYPYTQKYLKYRNHALFATFLFAGLRKSEVLNLKLSDIDLENLTLFVRQGKGDKDRIIPISSTLAHTLNRYLVERKKRHKTCPEFFTSSNKNQGFTDSGLKRLINKIKEASGIYFSSHKLRHTFATLMLEGGCDIYTLSRMMGHSDIKTTAIYLGTRTEHLRLQMTKHPLNNLVT